MKKRGLRWLGLVLLVGTLLSGCIVWPYYDDGYWGGGYGGHRHGHHRHHGW